MPRRVPLPPRFGSGSFAVGAARAAGIGEGRLRGPDLRAPYHGTRTRAEPAQSIVGRCREYLPLLRRGQRFSHATAALIWGCPLATSYSLVPLDVCGPARAPRTRGITGHHSALGRVVERHGLPVSDPVSAWLELASVAPLDELIVAADHLILVPRVQDPRDIRPYCTIEDLRNGLANFHGRGAVLATEALTEVRQGAASRPETLLRLLIVRNGFPEPEVNVEIIVNGRFLGYADLYFRRYRTISEYDGDHHRTDRKQYDKDILRIENMERAGEQVVRVRRSGLFDDQAATLARLSHALRLKG